MLNIVLVLLTLVAIIERGSFFPIPTISEQRNVNFVFNKDEVIESKVIQSTTKHVEQIETTTLDSFEVEDFINVNCILSLIGGCG